MEINGKVYRNLEGQVGYLTDKYDDLQNQINDVRAHLTHYVEVDQLPTGDHIDPSAVYLLGPMGTAPDQYYEEWVYVQKADESWVWEKLGDTDSVDLSGYLEKNTSTTVYPKVYIKWASGTQGMENLTDQAEYNAVVRRTATGQVNVPQTPTGNNNATSKEYVDDNFLAKQTGATSYPQVYVKGIDGSQDMIYAAVYQQPDSIVRRSSAGRVNTADPYDTADAVSLGYADNHYLAKQTGTTTTDQIYTKLNNGTQAMIDINQNAAGAATIVKRTSGGQVVCSDPTAANHAATKNYVDAAVGQLIYHHNMVINYTITGDTDYVKIAAHSDNNTSTAYTNIDWNNMPLVMPDYAMYHKGSNDYLTSVIKLPRALHKDEFGEPRDGFLITYWNGSAFVNELVNSNIYDTVTVTDAVTTW